MLGESAIVVVYGVPVNCPILVPVRNHMAMMLADGVLESEPKIIVAGVAGGRFRCGHKYSLQCKRTSRRQHHDDGDPSKNMVPYTMQNTISATKL